MARPTKSRTINFQPDAYYFKPRAVQMKNLEEVLLHIDELESLRLADYLAMTHEQAAGLMQISRATFGRILERARRKVIDAIINGKAIKVSDTIPDNLKNKLSEKCLHCGAPICKRDTSTHKCIIDNIKGTIK